MAPLVRVPRYRCVHQFAAFVAASPRGRVRSDQLTHVRIALTADYPDESVLEFRAGDRVVGRLPIEPTEIVTTIELPADLQLALQASREPITWGSRAGAAKYGRPTFEVDDPTWQEARRLRALDEQLSLQPAWIRSLLRGQLLLDLGFYEDARRAAKTALRDHPREPHAAALLHLANRCLGLAMTEEEAWSHGIEVVGPLYEERRERERQDECMLDEPLEHLPQRVVVSTEPRGGC